MTIAKLLMRSVGVAAVLAAAGISQASAQQMIAPASAREVPAEQLRDEDVDVVVLQRVRDLELVREWLGREPGRDLPAVFLEHNAPDGSVPDTRHPLADRNDIPIAHVTHFNRLFYDNGRAPTTVIEHGIVDPGERWTGELARAAVVTNEPVRDRKSTRLNSSH